jgi:environmental stress-induced protein Ves
MKTTILTSRNFKTTKWSGGTTTQLYISPINATLFNRDFKLRISTAKVETEESTFTSLPNVRRKLMILLGEITITHENQYSKHLKPFDIDDFCGDWTTSSKGTCIDFNVMTNNLDKSELYHLSIERITNFKLKPRSNYKSFGTCKKSMIKFYVYPLVQTKL